MRYDLWEKAARSLLKEVAETLDKMHPNDDLVRELVRAGLSNQLAGIVREASQLAMEQVGDPPQSMTLDNGARVVAFAGTPQKGIVLADHNRQYVVWRYERTDDGRYIAENGDYFPHSAEDRAWKRFMERQQRFFTGNTPALSDEA